MNTVDQLISTLDDALRAISGVTTATRAQPRPSTSAPPLDEAARIESARMMRVNHAGEVAAQALYSGQALVARDPRTRTVLETAAAEERDHLAWCSARIHALGGRTSVLDPFWYGGAFALGVASGLAGDRVSLGFLAETEAQVEAHLTDHLARLPESDTESKAVLEQMRADEHHHGQTGREAGGIPLPPPIPTLMQLASKVMTRGAYWL